MLRANHDLMEPELIEAPAGNNSSPEDDGMGALIDVAKRQEGAKRLRKLGEAVLRKYGYSQYNEIPV